MHGMKSTNWGDIWLPAGNGASKTSFDPVGPLAWPTSAPALKPAGPMGKWSLSGPSGRSQHWNRSLLSRGQGNCRSRQERRHGRDGGGAAARRPRRDARPIKCPIAFFLYAQTNPAIRPAPRINEDQITLNFYRLHSLTLVHCILSKNYRVAVISAKNHKRQPVIAKREKSQTPKVLIAIQTLPNLA